MFAGVFHVAPIGNVLFGPPAPRSVLQIPRILNPIADAVQSLEDLALDPILGQYVDVGWGGVHNAKMAILSDFFKVCHLDTTASFVMGKLRDP